MATLNERVEQHDREIAAIRNLVLEGMRLGRESVVRLMGAKVLGVCRFAMIFAQG